MLPVQHIQPEAYLTFLLYRYVADVLPENLLVLNRQAITVPGTNRPKKKSGLRLSFGPGEGVTEDESEDALSEVFVPKKSSLSRAAIEKNAARKSLSHAISTDRLPVRVGAADDRPSYSKDYLNELKTSTPSTPKDLGSLSASADEDEDKPDTLSILEKFGVRGNVIESAAIPSEAEIREKKERRARLAKENEFILLDDDSRGNEISLFSRKRKESRLVREDEDLGEGFDDFVEDGGISLGKKAEREQSRRRRAEMEELIHEAERSSADDTDESEIERRAEYEAAQTRAGAYTMSKDDSTRTSRPRTPPKITPLPSLPDSFSRLQSVLSNMEATKMAKVKELEDLLHQKSEIATREAEIQKLLKEAGENYERLRVEAGLGGGMGDTNGLGEAIAAVLPSQLMVNRGLESFGNSPIAPPTRDD
jgi:Nineteen complex-related protein 2